MTAEPRRPAHLRLVTTPEPEPQPARLTPDEMRAIEQVATQLRCTARTLPWASPLRAELIEIAEYYGAGGAQADDVATNDRP